MKETAQTAAASGALGANALRLAAAAHNHAQQQAALMDKHQLTKQPPAMNHPAVKGICRREQAFATQHLIHQALASIPWLAPALAAPIPARLNALPATLPTANASMYYAIMAD